MHNRVPLRYEPKGWKGKDDWKGYSWDKGCGKDSWAPKGKDKGKDDWSAHPARPAK